MGSTPPPPQDEYNDDSDDKNDNKGVVDDDSVNEKKLCSNNNNNNMFDDTSHVDYCHWARWSCTAQTLINCGLQTANTWNGRSELDHAFYWTIHLRCLDSVVCKDNLDVFLSVCYIFEIIPIRKQL